MNPNIFINSKRKEMIQQQTLELVQDKKEFLDKRITKKIENYKKTKGKHPHRDFTFLKKTLLEHAMLRMGPEDLIVANELLDDYKREKE